MSYLSVQNFKEGLDTRRSKITAPAGTLRRAVNCHVTRGGEIEKAKAWVSKYTLPAGTFGMHGTDSALFVFGSDSNPGVPAGVTYQQLVSASGTADMTEVLSSESFNGVPYVVAKFDDGNVHHFYNGVRVEAWDDIAPAISSIDTMGTALAALVNNSPTATASYNGGTNKLTVTGRTNDVPYALSAETINRGSNADNAVAVSTTQAAGGGLPQIVEITLSGTYEAADTWSVYITNSPDGSDPEAYTVTGAASGTGGQALTHDSKVYTTLQSLLYFSDINAPTNWTGTGAGFINMSNQSGGSATLTGLAPYQNYIAVFSAHTIQIWFMDTDPVNNRKVQVLDNTGTMASRSAINYGDIDVFYLDSTGVRSLRARDSSNSAMVFDIGTSIDTLVREVMSETDSDDLARACAVIEPTEGRYLLAIGETVFVFSFFPASKISAWTTYEPGFSVEWWAVRNNSLYARSGNTIYLYGGDEGETYDASEVVVELAHLDAGKPATRKQCKALDLACDGLWTIEANFDPRLDVWENLGSVTGENFSLPSFGMTGIGTHIGLRLTSPDDFAGYSRLSSIALHFDAMDAD